MSLPIVGNPGPRVVVTPEEVTAKIQEALPGAEVKVVDLTGTQDHYEVQVTSEKFEGLSLIQQHQLIYKALAEEMKGPIHALTLKTSTP
jgi:stress-induced morphogen